MTDKNIIRTIVIITIIAKFILGHLLISQWGIHKIYFIELTYLLFSAFLCYAVFKDNVKHIKYTMAFLICFDIINSIGMVYVFNTYEMQKLFYFHPLCAMIYFLWNKVFIGYKWLYIVINAYIFSILVRSIYLHVVNHSMDSVAFTYHFIILLLTLITNLSVHAKGELLD